MRLASRLVFGLLVLLILAGVHADSATAGDRPPNPDAVCDCKEGFGGCELYLHSPAGATFDPCFCDRCREFQPHDGLTVPEGMSPTCFQSSRMECYLKRHCVAWHIACSECMIKSSCCQSAKHPENCPNCDGDTNPLATDDMGRPAKETVLNRLKEESKLFKKSTNVIVLYNRHFYVVTDVGPVTVKTKSGGQRPASGHEYAHLMLQRAEMARKEFVQNFGDRLTIKKPVAIFLPSKERDAGTIQATYFGSAKTNLLYGGGDDSKLCGGMCANGFCASEGKNSADQNLFAAMRHMIGHSLISVWVVGGGMNRELPRWLFEGTGHWLCKYEERFRDEAIWCGDEGTPKTASGKDWEADCAKMAGDPTLDGIEKLFGKTAIGQLTIEDQKRSWSYLDLCLREWREPFVAMLAGIRMKKEIRDTFMENLKCTPEIFNERWRDRLTGRRKSMGPQADEEEAEGNDAPGARERRGLRTELDLASLAAKVRALGTVDSPKTVNVMIDLLAKNSELVRETVMVSLLKMKAPECVERLSTYGLAHSDGAVRACCARACGKLRVESAVPRLREMISEDRNWMARAEAAVSCGEFKDVKAMAAMRKAVTSDVADKAQLAAMDALGLFGEDASAAVPVIQKQLESGQWQLRVGAAQALGQIGSMEAVDQLVTRMEQETGRVREEIHDALKLICRDDLGLKPESWRKWWDREKANTPNGLPKRPEAPKKRDKDPNERYGEAPKYYGIEIFSSRIGFVLDTSLSMADRFEPDPKQAAQLSRTYTASSKLDICKEEIAQTLAVLDPRSHFSIITFSTRIGYFKKNPIPSSPANTASAASWLRGLPPNGETNYYGGLRAALDLDEGIDVAPQFKSTPDTLTFLTDGMPTQGEITDADVLLEWYTSLNRYARIRTHVIAFGTKGVDDVMLRKMAERNGGRFVQVAEKE